jgi:hypothetical protein
MSGDRKIGDFMEEFQKCMAGRIRKELTRFTGFFSQYGCLIDKRAEKDDLTHLKIEKYIELTKK